MKVRVSIEQLSIGLAHAIYRNTEVEDYHAENRLMEQALYDDVYKIVSERVKRFAECRDLLMDVYQNGISDALFTMKKYPKRQTDFLADILFGMQCGLHWDLPDEIDVCTSTDDLAAFLLDGVFKKKCDGIHTFDDSVMKPINKDMVDRVYVLLKKVLDKNDCSIEIIV